jgi:hypothetical protein
VAYIVDFVVLSPAGTPLPSPTYTSEKTEQAPQLPLSMDQLLGMVGSYFHLMKLDPLVVINLLMYFLTFCS